MASECFDSVSSLDVVYHQAVGSDLAALREFYRVLRPGGRLLIQVPAYDWLRSRHDDEVGTRERYSAAVLKDRLQLAGFAVERLTYANGLLLGAAVLCATERFTPAGPARDLRLLRRRSTAWRWRSSISAPLDRRRPPSALLLRRSVIATARRPFPPIHA